MSSQAQVTEAQTSKAKGNAGEVGASRRARRARTMSKIAPTFQVTPALVIFAACLVVPLAAFIVYSFWTVRDYRMVPEWNITNYTRILSSRLYMRLLLNTILTGLGVAAVTTTIAYALTHVLRFNLRQYQERILVLALVALFSGYLVRIFAWRTLLGDHGIINSLLLKLGVLHQPTTLLMYNRFATIVVLTNFLIPLAVLPVYASLQSIRDSEVEAARDLGCTALGAFTKVILPLAWRGVFTAFFLTFIITCGDYVTPAIVGGTSGTLIGVVIGQTFLTLFNWPLGAALSFVTIAAVLLSVAALRTASGRIVR